MKRIILSESITTDALVAALSEKEALLIVEADFDLKGRSVNMSASSMMQFAGGSLRHGTLQGCVRFMAGGMWVFREGLRFADDVRLNVSEICPEWFGAMGDYDLNTHQGHDDTAAINRAIEVAEQLSVKTLRFRAVNYWVTGVVINRGNVRLLGSGAQLREDQWERGKAGTDIRQIFTNRASMLCVAPGKSCVICGEDVADPVSMSDLQLVCDRKHAGSKSPTLGVDFRSTVNAPTWPVMFERCFFQGFDKAFCINSTLAYPLNYLKFQDCAFVENGYCVYASSVSEQIHAKSGMTRQCVWSFEFMGNKCHHNRYLLYINVQKGLCRIDNNNCEGTLGDEKAQTEGYALDVEIGQRATASICHNHFELNRTPLLRVVSSTSLDSQVTALGNNTDGVPPEMNRSYFERVKVETTMSAELCNCMFEGHRRVQRKVLLSGKSVVFTPDECLMPLQKGRAQAVVTSVSEQPSLLKKWVDTSFGRLCMGCYYANSFATTPVLNTVMKYQADMRYLNLEMLYVRRSPSVLFSNIYLRIGYMKGDKTLRVADVSPGHLYSPWSGSFRMRVQIPLEEVPESTDLHVQMAVYTDTKHLADVGELFIGCRHLLLSAERVDLYEQMATRHEMNLSLAEDEQFMIEKGERFVMGGFDVACLEGGCCLPATKFVHPAGTDYVVAPVRPLGSAWTDGLHTFRLVGLAAELTDYKQVKYYIDQSVDLLEWGKQYESSSPRLLGSGAGHRKDLDGSRGMYLCPGSSFYAVDEGKYYLLNDKRKWVVRN